MNPDGYVAERARKLRSSIAALEATWADGRGPDILDRAEAVISDANHLRKALRLPGLSDELAGAALDQDLDERVKRTRDHWEHWESDGRAREWFRRRGQAPGVLHDTPTGDISISGVYTLGELREVLEGITRAFATMRGSV